MAQFHQLMFKEKFAELLYLLECLGAIRVEIMHVSTVQTGITEEVARKTDLAGLQVEALSDVAQKVAATIGGAAGKLASQVSIPDVQEVVTDQMVAEGKIVYRANYQPIKEPFAPPESELVWVPFEAQWKQLQNSRLNAGLLNFELDLSYRQDFQVNRNTALQMVGLGLKLGGTFVDFQEIIWHAEGEFAPMS
jgi:hypothetical protein